MIVAESEKLYYSHVTIVRTKSGLLDVVQFVDSHKSNRNYFVKNRMILGSIVATAALTREESRGTHYREDLPQSNPAWEKRVVISRGKDNDPLVEILT